MPRSAVLSMVLVGSEHRCQTCGAKNRRWCPEHEGGRARWMESCASPPHSDGNKTQPHCQADCSSEPIMLYPKMCGNPDDHGGTEQKAQQVAPLVFVLGSRPETMQQRHQVRALHERHAMFFSLSTSGVCGAKRRRAPLSVIAGSGFPS